MFLQELACLEGHGLWFTEMCRVCGEIEGKYECISCDD